MAQTSLAIASQTAYLLYASDNNQNFKITQLDANYYNVKTNVATLDGKFGSSLAHQKLMFESGVTLEAPGIVKRNSVIIHNAQYVIY